MGDCDYAATGAKVVTDLGLFCIETTCLQLGDAETMMQLKRLLGEASSQPVADYTSVWTPQDARALAVWSNRTEVDLPGWFQGELYALVDGQPVPNGNTVRALLQEQGYPDSVELYRYYPQLAHTMDSYVRSQCTVAHLEASVPPRGEVTAPEPVTPEPGPAPDEELPDWVLAAQPGPGRYVAYGLALAALAASVTWLWRGRRR
jgi:hypothetical protein